jgi:hypothetical protein
VASCISTHSALLWLQMPTRSPGASPRPSSALASWRALRCSWA